MTRSASSRRGPHRGSRDRNVRNGRNGRNDRGGRNNSNGRNDHGNGHNNGNVHNSRNGNNNGNGHNNGNSHNNGNDDHNDLSHDGSPRPSSGSGCPSSPSACAFSFRGYEERIPEFKLPSCGDSSIGPPLKAGSGVQVRTLNSAGAEYPTPYPHPTHQPPTPHPLSPIFPLRCLGFVLVHIMPCRWFNCVASSPTRSSLSRPQVIRLRMVQPGDKEKLLLNAMLPSPPLPPTTPHSRSPPSLSQVIQVRTVQPGDSGKLRGEVVKVEIKSAQLEVASKTINLTPEDRSDVIPEDQRCVLFKIA
ncbi:unnamed protein product [Closterium sp. NIES-54]